MFLREVSVERLVFSCGGCGHTWSTDYDVQHVEDGHGHLRDYYFDDGVPCPDPFASGTVVCPRCGRTTLWVELTARRASPAIADTRPGDLGSTPTPARTAARADAPLLPHQPAPGERQ